MSIIVGVFLSLFSLSIYSSIRDAMIGVEFSVNPLCSGFWTDNIFPLILNFKIVSIILDSGGVIVISL